MKNGIDFPHVCDMNTKELHSPEKCDLSLIEDLPVAPALLDYPRRQQPASGWSITPFFHGIATLFSLALILPIMTLLRCVAIVLRIPGRQKILLYAARIACTCIGIRLHITGIPIDNRKPRMFVANHVSWLDIILLSATTPAFFIASENVRTWPLFGFMARIGETEFITQSRSAKAMLRERRRLEERLDKGESLAIFPEGGRSGRMRPGFFHSSMLIEQTAKGNDVWITPISLCYVAARGLPPDKESADIITMRRRSGGIPVIVWRLLGLLPMDVVVELHSPIRIGDRASRREAGDYCRRLCAEGVRRNQRAWAYYTIGDSRAFDNDQSLGAAA